MLLTSEEGTARPRVRPLQDWEKQRQEEQRANGELVGEKKRTEKNLFSLLKLSNAYFKFVLVFMIQCDLDRIPSKNIIFPSSLPPSF